MFAETAGRVRSYLKENGWRWTALYALWKGFHLVARSLELRMKSFEVKHQMAGTNTAQANQDVWQSYSWEQRGEEWTPSEAWKDALIDQVMRKHIAPGKIVLEIGPGAGRWTEALQKIAGRLLVVDISDKCIQLCKERFARCDNVEFYVNDGRSLAFLQDESVDYIWSLDAFVHIAPADTESYLAEFRRVLRRGGVGVVHHAKQGGRHGGWRSAMITDLFRSMLQRNGLTHLGQIEHWGDRGQFNLLFYDTITLFRRE